MNEKLQEYARQELKNGLSKLGDAQQLVFKRMYSNKNLKADINDVVDEMPEDKLDWAMKQVARTQSS